MSTQKKNPSKTPQNQNTPKPQKQWDEMPRERTSDPEQQQIERVLGENPKKKKNTKTKTNDQDSSHGLE